MQPTEQDDEIFVLVADETYDSGDTWAQDSERYRLDLEKEFGVTFTEANIGPGADMPAFLTVLATTTIPLWSVVLGAFFLGKPINENLGAWHAIGKRLHQFFKRPVYLSRNGAAVIAVETVFENIGGMPKTLQLCSYRISHLDEREFKQAGPSQEIVATPETLYLGFIWHIFEIEADGILFRVRVDGRTTKIIRLR
jgi:hypothetical protein